MPPTTRHDVLHHTHSTLRECFFFFFCSSRGYGSFSSCKLGLQAKEEGSCYRQADRAKWKMLCNSYGDQHSPLVCATKGNEPKQEWGGSRSSDVDELLHIYVTIVSDVKSAATKLEGTGAQTQEHRELHTISRDY